MAVSISQYVDLLFKKLQGVAKTANATVKGASNESIASPAFIRGDVVWMQADQIPSTAQVVSGVTSVLTNSNAIECSPDITVPPIGGIRPTWLSNEIYWVSQEFGATWLPKVFVGPSGAANIEATGTQIFSAGIGGVGEYYFDTQAGVLNFIGETTPSVLTAGNVVYVSGYQYIGDLGVTNIPSNANIGNLNITDATITNINSNGNITIDPPGIGIFNIVGTNGFIMPYGNTAQRPSPADIGTTRFNTALDVIEVWNGTSWVEAGGGSDTGTIVDQQITPDGSSLSYVLDQATTQGAVLVSFNGVSQLPGVAYTVSGNSITFSQAPESTDIIDIRFLASATTNDKILNTAGDTSVQATDINTIVFSVAESNVGTFTTAGVFNISAGHSLQLPVYTVDNATALSNVATGQLIYVSNGDSGNPCLAVYSGGAFKRVALGSTINT
jgi:hypothetical protein